MWSEAVCADAEKEYTKTISGILETAGARFIAARRMENVSRNLMINISLSSCYVIFATFVSASLPLDDVLNFFLTAFAVFFSLIILVASVLHFSEDYGRFAEQFHRSALELKEIERISRPQEKNHELIHRIIFSYNNTLQKYSINHLQEDYDMHRAQNPEKYSYISESERRKFKRAFYRHSNKIKYFFVFISIVFIAFVGGVLFKYFGSNYIIIPRP